MQHGWRQNHIAFNSNEHIFKLCEYFFKTKGIKINHCNIIQKNNDGTVSYLCSNRSWLLHYFEKSYPSIGAFEQDSSLSNYKYVFWDSLDIADPILRDSRELISVDHGITIIENFADGVRFYNLGSNKKSPTINDYANNLCDLNHFISFLKDKLSSIFKKAYDSRFVLPTIDNKILKLVSPDHEIFPKSTENKSNINTKTYISQNSYLSRRELECIEWYAKGKTSTEISYLLNISRRTVENHIENTKIKLGCVNLFQLGYMLASIRFKQLGYIPQIADESDISQHI